MDISGIKYTFFQEQWYQCKTKSLYWQLRRAYL